MIDETDRAIEAQVLSLSESQKTALDASPVTAVETRQPGCVGGDVAEQFPRYGIRMPGMKSRQVILGRQGLARRRSLLAVALQVALLPSASTLLSSCAVTGRGLVNSATADAATSLIRPLSDTGQSTSYTSISGEDSDRIVNPPSYADNGDGTVIDNVTGLMWEQDDGGEMTFEEAEAYVAGLNSGSSLGGYSDWRLPTAHELFGLNLFDTINPPLDSAAFPPDWASDASAAGKSTADYTRELYWYSGEACSLDISRVWVTNAGGGIGPHRKSETASAGGTRYFHVRAVRSLVSPSNASSHFTVNADGTATDDITGLVWMRTCSDRSYTWEEALAYVNGLNGSGGFADKTDWRLPNIRELYSIVETDRSLTPCLDSEVFTNVASLCPSSAPTPEEPGVFWSSTSMCNNSAQAWDLHDIYFGIISYSAKTVSERILLVRGGD